MLEVDINVGRFIALFGNETLKQHRGASRVNLGDAQAIAHRRVGRAAASLAQDALRARKAYDVMHGQEVLLVAQLTDQLQFVFDLMSNRIGQAFGIAVTRSFIGQIGQVARGCLLRRNNFLRIFVTQFAQREVAARGDVLGRSQQVGRVFLRQTKAAAQVPLSVSLQGHASVCHRCPAAYGAQHILKRFAGASMHVHIARGHQRHLCLLADQPHALQPPGVVHGL